MFLYSRYNLTFGHTTMIAEIGDIVQINLYDFIAEDSTKYTKVRFAIVVDTPASNWCIAKYFDDESICEFARNPNHWYDSKQRVVVSILS